jgi:uncharacterized protein
VKPRITIITLGVKDLPRAVRFYRDGLGFPTDAKDDAPMAIFMTGGVRLALYPKKALAEGISKDVRPASKGFGGITLAHKVGRKEEVAEVLALAEEAGAKIVKPAQDTFWGGYSGYFADLDGYFGKSCGRRCVPSMEPAHLFSKNEERAEPTSGSDVSVCRASCWLRRPAIRGRGSLGRSVRTA